MYKPASPHPVSFSCFGFCSDDELFLGYRNPQLGLGSSRTVTLWHAPVLRYRSLLTRVARFSPCFAPNMSPHRRFSPSPIPPPYPRILLFNRNAWAWCFRLSFMLSPRDDQIIPAYTNDQSGGPLRPRCRHRGSANNSQRNSWAFHPRWEACLGLLLGAQDRAAAAGSPYRCCNTGDRHPYTIT